MINERFNVGPLNDELRLHPEIWNTIPYRTRFDSSPHREVDDIWVRYNALEHFDPANPSAFNEPHNSVWYPVCQKIPAAQLLAIELHHRLQSERLGEVLITRIPAGKQVYPHTDPGWHASFYDKFVIQIASARGQAFCFADEKLEAWPGECYWFDNSVDHWVVNPTEQERISLIVCLRRPTCH